MTAIIAIRGCFIAARHACVYAVAALMCITLMAPAHAEPPATTQASELPWESGPEADDVGASLLGLAAHSTDVMIADVVRTNPRLTGEGGRDNAILKVVETLHGSCAPGQIVDLYYHLHWLDQATGTREPAKIAMGKRYVFFLNAERGNDEFILSDQRNSIMPLHAGLVPEVKVAIRVAHGDSCGEWTWTGILRARLVAYRFGSWNTATVGIFLDVRSGARGGSVQELDLSNAAITWSVVDQEGKPVEPSAADPQTQPLTDQKALVIAQTTTRLTLAQLRRAEPDERIHLSLITGKTWIFNRGLSQPYFLTGTITSPFTSNPIWSGTFTLPKVRLPLD